MPEAINPVKLRDLLVAHFSVEELNGLMFELDIRRDEVAGDTIGARALELVEHCRRRPGRLDDLLAAAMKLRPGADWAAVRAAAQPAAASPNAAALRELSLFRDLLAEGRLLFIEQNVQRGKLYEMLLTHYGRDLPSHRGYDDLFYQMYDRLTPDEMNLFKMVRGQTRTGMYRINGRIRDWLEGHNVGLMLPNSTPAVEELEREIMALKLHLTQWFAKYEELFLPDPKRGLVYLGDELALGRKWPRGLEPALDALLAELAP